MSAADLGYPDWLRVDAWVTPPLETGTLRDGSAVLGPYVVGQWGSVIVAVSQQVAHLGTVTLKVRWLATNNLADILYLDAYRAEAGVTIVDKLSTKTPYVALDVGAFVGVKWVASLVPFRDPRPRGVTTAGALAHVYADVFAGNEVRVQQANQTGPAVATLTATCDGAGMAAAVNVLVDGSLQFTAGFLHLPAGSLGASTRLAIPRGTAYLYATNLSAAAQSCSASLVFDPD